MALRMRIDIASHTLFRILPIRSFEAEVCGNGCGLRGILDVMDTSCSNEYLTKGPWVRTVVGLTCVLAMIGAAFIIFTYVCFPDLRSKPRAILLQLSVMDFGIGCANFVGDVVNFDRFYHNGSCDSEGHLVFHETNALANGFCVAQAFFAHFCTIGSVLWTMGLSVYIYFLIVHHKKPWKAKYALWLAYVLCWGIPMLDTLWLLGSKRLGYSPYDTSGWCGPIVINPKTREPNAFLNFISYDVWIVLAMLVVPLLYFAVELYLRVEASLLAWMRLHALFVDNSHAGVCETRTFGGFMHNKETMIRIVSGRPHVQGLQLHHISDSFCFFYMQMQWEFHVGCIAV